ncbi:hypothetical protein EZS27_013665 [termite gut metagenome]|uniref:Uncharacterized protein n=1 Tax=termite gut metagenome TaxID=433724 RepID=A0A5J4RWG7_9ZZZZ
MALIRTLEPGAATHKNRICTETDAEYVSFKDDNYGHIVAIKTTGSDNKQNPGKCTQNIQINKEIAQQIVSLLKSEFRI